jgi:protein-L-isoaspartate(D-aspartate) O-methyltransferase
MPQKEEWERLVQSLISEGILHSPHVIRAMHKVNRAMFLPENMHSYCAVDSPLPIGSGQTISAPHD